MNRPRVLVVDDYEDGGLMQAYALEAAGFDVVTASGGLEALEETRRYRPAVVVMGIRALLNIGMLPARRGGSGQS
jgi:DNA-binding response OmpR family regulator